MLSCTFFGHKNTTDEIIPILKSSIIDLIKNKNVTNFYVGNHGCFDAIVIKILKELKILYPQIDYFVVLAYMPLEKDKEKIDYYGSTIYPENLELVPPRFAIIKRNKWMIEASDFVITYVYHHFGNSAKFEEMAEKKNKTIIKLATK